MTTRDRVQLWVARHLLPYWDERIERGRNGRTEAIRLRAIAERKNVERVMAQYRASNDRLGR